MSFHFTILPNNLIFTFYFNECLLYMFQLTPDNATSVTRAAVVLHNIMRDRYPGQQNQDLQVPAGAPGSWRTANVLPDVEAAAGRGPRLSKEGNKLRAYLKAYYNSNTGRVLWQDDVVNGVGRM